LVDGHALFDGDCLVVCSRMLCLAAAVPLLDNIQACELADVCLGRLTAIDESDCPDNEKLLLLTAVTEALCSLKKAGCPIPHDLLKFLVSFTNHCQSSAAVTLSSLLIQELSPDAMLPFVFDVYIPLVCELHAELTPVGPTDKIDAAIVEMAHVINNLPAQVDAKVMLDFLEFCFADIDEDVTLTLFGAVVSNMAKTGGDIVPFFDLLTSVDNLIDAFGHDLAIVLTDFIAEFPNALQPVTRQRLTTFLFNVAAFDDIDLFDLATVVTTAARIIQLDALDGRKAEHDGVGPVITFLRGFANDDDSLVVVGLLILELLLSLVVAGAEIGRDGLLKCLEIIDGGAIACNYHRILVVTALKMVPETDDTREAVRRVIGQAMANELANAETVAALVARFGHLFDFFETARPLQAFIDACDGFQSAPLSGYDD
jgi:hypothetical protein